MSSSEPNPGPLAQYRCDADGALWVHYWQQDPEPVNCPTCGTDRVKWVNYETWKQAAGPYPYGQLTP